MFVSAGVFTVAMIVIYLITGSVPDTLVTEFFGFFKVEGGALGIIKVAETLYDLYKNKKQNEQNRLESEINLEETVGRNTLYGSNNRRE